MGNTPSQEAPRAASRKLSKPRVTGRDRPRDRVTASAPASELAVHHVKAAQFSNSYLVGTVPIPASQRTSIDVASPGPAQAVFHDHFSDPARTDPSIGLPDPKSPRQGSFKDSLRAERIERRRSAGPGPVHGSASPSQTPYRQERNSVQGIARTSSVHTTKTQPDSRNVPSITEEPMPRSQSLVERRASLHSRSNSRGGESQDAACNLRRNSTTPQPEMPPPHRTQSETSLYPPHRRRSLVMTPGVATRAEVPKKLRRKASFRRSLEPTPSVSRENSVDSKASRHMSLPVLPSDLQNRAPTPSEADFKQLGGMMFGTLRITNGAPAPSPEQEPDESALYTPKAVAMDDTVPLEQTSSQTTLRDEPGLHLKTRGAQPHLVLESPPQRSPRSKAGYSSAVTQASPRSPHSPSLRQLPVTVRPPTPELQTTSKHAAVDDHLFEEEDDSPRVESMEPVTQVVEVARELDVGMKSPTRPSLVHVTRKDSGYVSNTSKSSRRTLSTVDSGYSSNVSVRSIQQKRTITEGSGDYLTSASHSSDSNGSSPLGDASSNGARSLRSEEIPSPPEEGLQPSVSSKDDASVSTPRTSTSSTAHSIIRLPSLRSGKSREQKPLRHSPSQDRPRSAGNLLQSFSSPSRVSSPSVPRMSGLRRLLSGGSRKGLATSYAVHEIDGSVPSVPLAAEQKLQGHNDRFPTAPKRLALRVEQSHDSLGTIISMDDTSEAGAVEKETTSHLPPPAAPQAAPEPQRQPEPTQSAQPERRRSARLSISSVSGSITAATSMLSPKSSANPRNVIRRRSTMDDQIPTRSNSRRTLRGSDVDPDSDDEVIFDGSVIDHRDFMLPSMRRSIGNSTFDQARLGLGDQGRYPTPDNSNWMNQPYVDPRATRRQPQLRNRKSCPDVRATMAGHLSPVFERDSVMASKTPPPISLQTRGSKKRRGGSSRRKSSTAGVPHYPRPASRDPYDSGSSAQSSAEDLGHYGGKAPMSTSGPYPRAAPLTQSGPYPSQQRAAPQPQMKRPLFGQRFSYDGHGYQPPPMQHQKSSLAPMPSREQSKDHWMPNRHLKERDPSPGSRGSYDQSQDPRPSSSRTSGDGNPPFRVLHSYNSPAYKGIPIWG